MQVGLLGFPSLGAEPDTLLDHLVLDEGQQLVGFGIESGNGSGIGQHFVKRHLDDVNAGVHGILVPS